MKKLIIILCLLFSGVAWGETIVESTRGPLQNREKQLIDDGNMEAIGTSDWECCLHAICSKEANGLLFNHVLRVTDNGIAPYARQVALVAGEQYHIRGRARGDGTNYPTVWIGSHVWTGTTSTEWQDVDIVASATSGYFGIYCFNTNGNYCEFDDIFVTEAR